MIVTKTSAKSTFETGDRPSQTDFDNLIDSYVQHPGAVGVVEVLSTASATSHPLGAFGEIFLSSETTASAQGHLGVTVGAVGLQILAASTTAEAQGDLGLGTAAAVNTGVASGEIALNQQPQQSIAAAATVDLTASTSEFVRITGSGTVTSFGTGAGSGGLCRTVRLSTGVVLQHGTGSGNLSMPNGADYTGVANDTFDFYKLGDADVWLCTGYKLVSGKAIVTQAALSLSYESAAQTITSAGSLTLAHGLGVAAEVVQLWLECVTTEAGYSVGEKLPYYGDVSLSNNVGCAVWPDATNLNIRYGSDANPFSLPHKTTGVATALTNTKWNAIFRAYA